MSTRAQGRAARLCGLVVAAVCLIGAVACSGESPTATNSGGSAGSPVGGSDIYDIVWNWASVTNQTTRVATAVPDPASYTITFRHDGALTGKADCNSFTGTYTQDSGFDITVEAVTEAYCGEDSLDAQYLELLANIVAGGPDGAGGFALETAAGEQRMLFANGGPAPAE